MNEKQKQLSGTIEMMRFPLIFLVIFIHMVPFENCPVSLPSDGKTLYIFISEFVSHNLGAVAVPCFFSFSGYFFFSKIEIWSWKEYGSSLKKRFRTLLCPYIFWNLLIVGVAMCLNLITDRLGIHREKQLIPDLYNMFWGMPANYPLWYIRDLMCMVIASPMLYWLIKEMKSVALLLLFLAYMFVYESNIPGFSTTAFFFFCLGGYCSFFKIDILKICQKTYPFSVLIGILGLILSTLYSGTIYHEYILRGTVVISIIGIFGIFMRLRQYSSLKERLLQLSGSAFFVYALHEIYIINWLKGGFVKMNFSYTAWGAIVGYFVIPFICVATCLTIYYLAGKYTPCMLTFVTGGRGFNGIKKGKNE